MISFQLHSPALAACPHPQLPLLGVGKLPFYSAGRIPADSLTSPGHWMSLPTATLPYFKKVQRKSSVLFFFFSFFLPPPPAPPTMIKPETRSLFSGILHLGAQSSSHQFKTSQSSLHRAGGWTGKTRFAHQVNLVGLGPEARVKGRHPGALWLLPRAAKQRRRSGMPPAPGFGRRWRGAGALEQGLGGSPEQSRVLETPLNPRPLFPTAASRSCSCCCRRRWGTGAIALGRAPGSPGPAAAGAPRGTGSRLSLPTPFAPGRPAPRDRGGSPRGLRVCAGPWEPAPLSLVPGRCRGS